MKLIERDLQIHFTDAIDGFVFDQMKQQLPNYHGISEMSRVDFVVELDTAILFIELKDTDRDGIDAASLEKFYEKLDSGKLSSTFASKFINTFLYRWSEEKINKPIHYLSLVTLEEGLLAELTDSITKKFMFLDKKGPRWKRRPLENCQVFNIESWNENFPKWPVTRLNIPANA
ncbi:MAG: hypothetical protein JKY93_01905 [Gammaproteobacteria bacterium]|nr:hypothetical protein [Gammaproteobacteria bacterium]